MARIETSRLFASTIEWGKLGRIIAALASVCWVGLQGYEDVQRQMIETRDAMHELTSEVHSAFANRDDHEKALKAQIDLQFGSLTARVVQLEAREDANERRSRDTEATLAALKEQSMATYAAVSQIQSALLPSLMQRRSQP